MSVTPLGDGLYKMRGASAGEEDFCLVIDVARYKHLRGDEFEGVYATDC